MRTKHAEVALIAAIVGSGLLLRYLFVLAFPVRPVSDFLDYVEFAQNLRNTTWSHGTYYWAIRGAGLPSTLALLSVVIPIDMARLGLWATATVVGLTPLAPLLLWRDALPLRARVIAGALLAFWPGQLASCNLVGQDNWVIVPAVLLATLAVRAWTTRRGHPIAGVALWVYAAWIRPEMLVVLAPVAAVTVLAERASLERSAVTAVALAVVLLGLIGGQRVMGGESLRLNAPVKGLALLGSAQPGNYPDEWREPEAFAACRAQQRVPGESSDDGMWRLGVAELKRRPAYHAVRIFHGVATSWCSEGAGATYWSLMADALPRSSRTAGRSFQQRAFPLIFGWNFLLHTLALASAALCLGSRSPRSPPMLAIVAAIVLMAATHGALSVAPRFFVFSSALEFIVIAVTANGAITEWSRGMRRPAVACLGLSLLAMVLMAAGSRQAVGYLASRAETVRNCEVLSPR